MLSLAFGWFSGQSDFNLRAIEMALKFVSERGGGVCVTPFLSVVLSCDEAFCCVCLTTLSRAVYPRHVLAAEKGDSSGRVMTGAVRELNPSI